MPHSCHGFGGKFHHLLTYPLPRYHSSRYCNTYHHTSNRSRGLKRCLLHHGIIPQRTSKESGTQ